MDKQYRAIQHNAQPQHAMAMLNNNKKCQTAVSDDILTLFEIAFLLKLGHLLLR